MIKDFNLLDKNDILILKTHISLLYYLFFYCSSKGTRKGRDAVKALIKDNSELADELEAKIKALIKEKNA